MKIYFTLVMKRYHLLISIGCIVCFGSCAESENKIRSSLIDLGSETETTISESKSVLQKFDGWEYRKYYGIDISHYQGDVIQLMASTDSLHFVIAKATEGTGYIDPDFRSNWREIKDKGLIRGAYHFYRFGDDPVKQAQHFTDQIKDIEFSDISPIVDVEGGSLGQNISKAKMNTDLMKFLQYLETATKRKPIIYTNTSFSNEYLTNTAFSNYQLWLAEYTKGQPRVPELWKNSGYLLWQKSQNYNDYSITTDFDLFHGRLNELLR